MKFCRYLPAFLAGTLLASASFSQTNHFIIANFEGGKENDRVYLHSNREIQDSAIIKNKQARFPLTNKEKVWDMYFISYRGEENSYYSFLFHDAQSDITFTVNKEFSKWTISGMEHAVEQNRFWQGLYALGDLRQKLEKQLSETSDSLKREALQKEVSSFEQRFRDYSIQWVLTHKASPFSAAVIRIFIDRSNITKESDTVAENCFDQLLPEAKADNFESFVLQQQLANYNEKYARASVNATAPAFIIQDTTGNNITLEQFKGKWLLIDFWASWCGPCRKNNPLLKELFLKYRDKGLEVLSISVDTDRQKWKEAIIKDEMNWHQGSDLLGQDGGVGAAYLVNAVPVYFLLSPEGRIVSKSVGGDISVMEESLSSLLNK